MGDEANAKEHRTFTIKETMEYLLQHSATGDIRSMTTEEQDHLLSKLSPELADRWRKVLSRPQNATATPSKQPTHCPHCNKALIMPWDAIPDLVSVPRVIVKEAINGVVFEVCQWHCGSLSYWIKPEDRLSELREVSRDDFMALAAFMRAMAAAQLTNEDDGIAWKLGLIAEALDPAIEDTLAHRLLTAIDGIWNCMPG